MSGGQAIETLARRGDPRVFDLKQTMTRQANCNFSFSGIKSHMKKVVEQEEARLGKIIQSLPIL